MRRAYRFTIDVRLVLSGSDSFGKETRGLSSAFQLLRALHHGSSGRPKKRLILPSISC